MQQKRKRTHNGFCRGLSVLSSMAVLSSSMVPAMPVLGAEKPVGSRVVYSGEGYERDLALEVGGEPFFYNGVQIRIDKEADVYGFNDAQIKQLMQMAKDDGFTVANMQIRWSDIQPDKKLNAKESATVSEKEADQPQTGTLKVEGADAQDDHYTYLKYDLSQFADRDAIEAAKLRVNLPDAENDLTKDHVLYAYNVTEGMEGADFSGLTWENTPVKDTEAFAGTSTKVWDPVKNATYYDIDVTEQVNEQLSKNSGADEITLMVSAALKEDGKSNGELIQIENAAYAPQLVVSEDKDEYDWSYLDKYLGWAEEIGLKVEILWFATDTCSITSDNRVPFYVYNHYQLSMADVDKPFFKKQSGDWAVAYGIYWYLMCKNDPNMKAQEAATLKALFNHVAEFDAENGNKNTVVGCQVSNEPNVSRLHNGSVYDANGTKVQHCMCETCQKLKKELNLSDQGFRDYTMFEYNNNLAKAVKTSNYPVWTRVNNVQGNDAWGVTYNEQKRREGGTDKDGGTYLDFIGLDPYGWGRKNLYDYGTGSYSTGQNLPVVMESGGENSMSALMMLATVAGGGFYNVYDLCSSDGHHLYDQNMQPRVIAAGDKYLPEGGTYIEDVRNHNKLLNKIAYELAVKKPDSLGGKDLLFFNCEGTELQNINVTKQIEGMDVTYKSNTRYASGIAVKRSGNEVVLLNTQGKDATFTLSQIADDVKSVEYGQYEGTEWASDAGEVSYQKSGSDLVVKMPVFSCVRVETNSELPKPTYYETEDLVEAGNVTVSNGLQINNHSENGAHGGRWTEIKNAPVGAKVTFEITVPENLSAAQIATGYKSNTPGRATVQLSVNGKNYGTPLDMTGEYGYRISEAGPIVELKPGQKNTLTYTVTKAGHVCLDYINFIKRDSMPDALEGKILIDEDFSDAKDTFGFPRGASVSDGALHITEGMGNYTTSVKNFDAEILGQSAVELSFDWKSNVTSNGKKSGIEFRDLYGKLIFALASKSGTELRYSVTSRDSDSTRCEYDWEPKWTTAAMDRTKTYTVRLVADFENHVVSYSIAEKDTGNVIAQQINVPIEAESMAKMVAANYYTVENQSYVGTQDIDNFKLIGKDDAVDLPYKGKTIYAFGDDIMAGYAYEKAGYVQFAAAAEGMEVSYDGAVNGATVMESDKQILSQIEAAPANSPDVVIFNGGLNDFGTGFDKASFSKAFENVVTRMSQKWPEAKLIYTTTHKMSGAASGIAEADQEQMYQIVTDICKKHGVCVADLYQTMDASEDTCRQNKTFDELGQDSLPGTMATISSEKFSSQYPSGKYPNFTGIREYYVPAIAAALRKSAESGDVHEFEDVHEDDWFRNDVAYVSEKGIMTGLKESVFGPGAELSRAEFATILYRLAGSPEVTYENKFSDVKEGEFYTSAVMWASEHKIVNGYGNTGLYEPGRSISREELSVMLRRYAAYSGQDVTAAVDLSSYPDGDSVSEFAEEGMSWAVANHIIRGAEGQLLKPQDKVKRAECAAIIHRYLEK